MEISNYKTNFAKRYIPSWSEDIFVIKKVKNNTPWTNVISDLNAVEIIGTFYEKELQRTSQPKSRTTKIIIRKSDKRFVKCKGYVN